MTDQSTLRNADDMTYDAKKAVFHDGQPMEKVGHLYRQVKIGRTKEKRKQKPGLLCLLFQCCVILMLRL